MNELEKFVDAALKLSENWKEEYNNGYPLKKDFDELVFDLLRWKRKVKENNK